MKMEELEEFIAKIDKSKIVDYQQTMSTMQDFVTFDSLKQFKVGEAFAIATTEGISTFEMIEFRTHKIKL